MASVISLSQTQSTTGTVQNRVFNSLNKGIGFIFPIYEEIVKRIHISRVFYFITMVITFVQFIIQSIWPYSLYDYGNNSGFSKFIASLTKIVFFFDPLNKTVIPVVPLIVTTAVFALTVIIIAIELAHYKVTISFNKYLLYVYRVIIECIAPIFILPSITLSIAILAGALLQNFELIYLLYSVLVFIPSIFFLILLKYHYTLVSASPFLQHSQFTAIVYKTPITIWTFAYIMQILQIIVVIFPLWTSMFAAVIHALVFGYCLWLVGYLPFLWHPMNVIHSALIVGAISCDLFSILQAAYPIVSGLPIYAGLIAATIAAVSYYIGFNRAKAKIRNNLKALEEETKLEQNKSRMKIELMDRYNLNYSPRLYQTYAQIAIENRDECYIPDGSIIFYGLEKFNENDITNFLLIISSFIPSFSKPLSLALKQIYRKKNPSIADRFLTFTLMRMKILRQSSVSAQFSEDIISVRQESNKCRSIIKGFMANPPDYVSFLNTYYNIIQTANNHWIEFTAHYPNSSKGYDEYADYLVDVMTDFKAATVQKHKTSLIDDGKRLHKDWVFRSFIYWWPYYLKKGIVDMHGVIEKKIRKWGSQSTTQTSNTGSIRSNPSSSSSYTSIDQMFELAPEDEDMYAKNLFTQHKLRLAYQRSIDSIDIPYSSKFKICALISTIAVIAAYISVNLAFGDFFETRSSEITQVKNINYARFYISIVRFISYLYFSQQNGHFIMGEDFNKIVSSDPKGVHYIDFQGDLVNQALKYVTNSNVNFNKFIDMLVVNALSGVDIYDYAALFLKNQINVTLCYDNPPKILGKPSITSLKALYSYTSIELQLLYIEEIDKWPISVTFCNIVNNIVHISNAFDEFIVNVINEEAKITERDRKILNMVEIYLPSALSVFCLVIVIVPLVLYYLDLKRLLNIFTEIPSSSREDIARTLNKGGDNSNSAASLPSSLIIARIFIITIIITLISPAILLVSYIHAKDVNNDFESLTNWMNIGGARGPALSEAIEHLSLAILTKNDVFPSVKHKDEVEKTNYFISQFIKFHLKVTDGDENIRPCNGFDKKLDELHFGILCDPNESIVAQHERYRCASLSQDAAFVKTFIDDAIIRIDSIDRCDSPEILEIYHIANVHMYDKLFQISERIDELGVKYQNKFNNFCFFIMISGIIIQIVIFLIYYYICIKLDNMYNAGKSLLRRISPSLLLQSRKIMDLITNKKKKEGAENMTFSQNIIFSSTDGVLFLNKNGIIEMVNNSINDILGYVPDQILGQKINLIFKEASALKVDQHLSLMKNNETAHIFEDHLECIADDASALQCNVTILGLANQGQNEISTFAMFIRDETAIIKKCEVAEIAKKQSEDLLYEILPRDIVFKLNQGETDITFTVPSATIMFIDIVKFSDYARNLSPQQIMGNLSLIFDSFDKHLSSYDLITKIKLIGDIYMCASGLFMPSDGNPQDHAIQMIKFGLDCLQDIEDINTQLESILSVRIGVNTGGPVIGGILGTDKPVFDIIGDPINVASRLQSTDIPGKIQIPQSTFDYVNTLDLNIEKRGEVFLKGKGNVTTYLISPINIFNLTTNTITTSLMVLNQSVDKKNNPQ